MKTDWTRTTSPSFTPKGPAPKGRPSAPPAWLKRTVLGTFTAGVLCALLGAVTDSGVLYWASFTLLAAAIVTVLAAGWRLEAAPSPNREETHGQPE